MPWGLLSLALLKIKHLGGGGYLAKHSAVKTKSMDSGALVLQKFN